MASYNRKTISINFDGDLSRRSCLILPHSRQTAVASPRNTTTATRPISGKVYERSKPRKVASPTWEIRSGYPSRGNIWDYLNDKGEGNSNCSSKRRAKVCCKQTGGKDAPYNVMWLVLFLFLLCFVTMTYSRLSDFILQSKFMTKVVPKTRLFSLLSSDTFVEEECCHVMKNLGASILRAEQALSSDTFVEEECCHVMKNLGASILRAEQALRNTQRIRRLMLISSRTSKSAISEGDYIDNATVMRGADTREWGGRVALWGLLPLWRAGPPPDTVLATREPVPSDCWPFRGSYGELIIKLGEPTEVSRISFEHVRPDIANSAPRNVTFYGVLENGTSTDSVEAEYQARGPAKQFFELTPKNSTLQRLIIRISTNQGNPQYTCVYRVRLYKNKE